VQDTVVQAISAWPGFRGDSRVSTWLFTLAGRACQRRSRRRAGEPKRVPTLSELAPFDEPGAAQLPEPADEAERREALQRVESAIAGLPEEFRIALVLREIVGMPVNDVAAVLGVAPGTVKSRLHRAKLLLRDAVVRGLPATAAAAKPAYDRRVCLDLLRAKLEAEDRGERFADDGVLCERCRGVFRELDLAAELCHDLGRGGTLPADLRQRLTALVEAPEQKN
jgi:RNA polymerase sigma factor (sigma-70 family)